MHLKAPQRVRCYIHRKQFLEKQEVQEMKKRQKRIVIGILSFALVLLFAGTLAG